MSEIDSGGSAFPKLRFSVRVPLEHGNWIEYSSSDQYEGQGMTLRDWFAGQAMLHAHEFYPAPSPERLAQKAYEIADAMLKERAK